LRARIVLSTQQHLVALQKHVEQTKARDPVTRDLILVDESAQHGLLLKRQRKASRKNAIADERRRRPGEQSSVVHTLTATIRAMNAAGAALGKSPAWALQQHLDATGLAYRELKDRHAKQTEAARAERRDIGDASRDLVTLEALKIIAKKPDIRQTELARQIFPTVTLSYSRTLTILKEKKLPSRKNKVGSLRRSEPPTHLLGR